MTVNTWTVEQLDPDTKKLTFSQTFDDPAIAMDMYKQLGEHAGTVVRITKNEQHLLLEDDDE